MTTNPSVLSAITKRLSEMEERRRLALQVSNTGIWDWNILNDTLVWDSGMLSIYDLTEQEFGGNYEAWSKRLHPEDLEQTEKALARCIANPAHPYFYRFRIMKNGVWRMVSGFGNCIRDESGAAMRMVGINILEPEHCAKHEERFKRHDPCDICPSRFMKMYETV